MHFYNLYSRQSFTLAAVFCCFAYGLMFLNPEVILALCFCIFCLSLFVYATPYTTQTLDYHHSRIKQAISRLAFTPITSHFKVKRHLARAKLIFLTLY